jgi:protein SCO1/2
MKRTGRISALILTMIVLTAAPPLHAQRAEPVPQELQDVKVTEHPDVALPLDAQFVDENGNTVRLGDFFSGDRPVILTLNYYECPMLCGLQLNGLVDGLDGLDWTPGDQFEIVTISINPLETPTLAKLKKQNYIKHYGRPKAAAGWHFLTGRESDIRRVADTVGFGYRYDPKAKQYAHPAVMFVVTPAGHVARYLYGIELPTKTLRLALVEAAKGKVGSAIDRIVLYCYHYDPSTHRYAPVAMNIMRLGGGATLAIFGTSLLAFWVRDSRKRRSTDGGNERT